MTIPEVLIVTKYLLKLRADYQESANIYCAKFNDPSLSDSQKESWQLMCETSRTVVSKIDLLEKQLEENGDNFECKIYLNSINSFLYSSEIVNEINYETFFAVNRKQVAAH